MYEPLRGFLGEETDLSYGDDTQYQVCRDETKILINIFEKTKILCFFFKCTVV